MISTAPGTFARRVLELLVAMPGELDAEGIADLLHPAPRHVGPFTSASYQEHRERLVAHRSAEARAARTAKVSATLHRLQQQGLVARRAGLHVAPWFEEMIERRRKLVGVRAELDALSLADQPDEDEERPSARSYEAHVAVLARVRACPGSVRAARPDGWSAQAYADLAAWGVLATPAKRWPTEQGRELVGGA